MRVIYLIPDHEMNGAVSHERGVIAAVDAKAQDIYERAKERLRQVRDEGNARVEVQHRFSGRYGDTDSLVWLIDEPHQRPDGSWSEGNAWAIEFGHIHNRTGKDIPGKFIVYGAAGLL